MLTLHSIEAEIKRRHLEPWFISDCVGNYKDAFIIHGPASVAITDREGHKITIPALQKAVAKFMENPKYRDLNIFHCLTPATEIRTATGTMSIKDIVVGDGVFTHHNRLMPVIRTYKHYVRGNIIRLQLSNDCVINITDAHPILMASGEWVAAGKVKVGDLLSSFANHNSPTVIKSVYSIEYVGNVYNLEVKNDNSYCGKGIIYHNSDVQVGEILPQWTHPDTGKIYKTEVNNNGWWVTAKIRGDLEIAKKVREEIEKGNLRSFSIAGTAKDKTHNYDSINPHEDINDLEIYECTIPNTRIQTLTGEKEIKDVVLGDYVLTHNMRFMPVTKLFKRDIDGAVYNLYLNNNSTLTLTPNHPVLIKDTNGNKWIRADDLEYKLPINNFVGMCGGIKTTNINKIELSSYRGMVYNLEVKEDHSYIANNIVVKNCTICVDGVNQFARFNVLYQSK